MPLLHLQLLPIAEGSNVCEVSLPHSIRSQHLKYKKSLISVIPDNNVASDIDGDSENLDLFPQGCVMIDLPFFTGYEITSNVGGGGLLPVCVRGRESWMGSTALTQQRADFNTDYHISLTAEEIPSKFRCTILKADGRTPQPMTLKTLGQQTDGETGFVRQIDVFFEYDTNNLFF